MRFAAVLASLALFTIGAGAAHQAAERTIYVSAVGANGMPVVDPPLTPAELTVAEDGVAREISSITKASEPVYFALLYETTQCAADSSREVRCDPQNNESNAINFLTAARDALSGFVNLIFKAAPTSKVLLMDVGSAAVVKKDFSSDPAELEPILRKLVTQKAEPVVHEALMEAANLLSKVPSRRRVIVVVNREPTTEGSSVEPRLVAEAVRKSGASVWSLAVRYGSKQDGNRDVLLKGLAANTGGHRLALGTPTQLTDYLTSVAANTIVQYAVTIKRPGDAPPAKMTTVKTSRSGVQPLTLQWSEK
jgi:hypothetical protein